MANLCGKNIRCSDCDEFTWQPHVCEPLRKMENMTREDFIDAKMQLELKHSKEMQALRKQYVKVNAKYKVGDRVMHNGIPCPIIDIGESIFRGHVPVIAYTLLVYTRLVYTKKGQPRCDKEKVVYLESDLWESSGTIGTGVKPV